MLEMPILKTERLIIRPFQEGDLQSAHQLFDHELDAAEMGAEALTTLKEREDWLQWSTRNHRHLALLNQPPYGDRAIVLKTTGILIGSCGLVPALNAFEKLPYFRTNQEQRTTVKYTPEVALFYAISPAHQHQGYALEAAHALIRYAFNSLHLKRIIAETDFTNTGSIAVMRKLGMIIEQNPFNDPPWLQVVGILENEENQ